MLELRASAGLYTHTDGTHARVPVGQFKIGRIAESRTPHLTNDVQHDPNVSDPAWAAREGMVAFAGYPLVVEGRVLGVLALFARHKLSESLMADLGPIAASVAQYLDRRRATEAVRESEERFRSMADSVPALIWLSELDGRRTYFNRTWLEFTGRAAEQEAGYGWAENIHPDYRDAYLGAYAAALAERRPFELEYLLRRRDGADRWVTARGTPRFTPSGTFAGFVGLCLDMTDRRQATEAVRLSEERYRVLTEAVPHVVWNADAAGEVTYFNRRWLEYTGLPLERACGRGWLDAVHPDEREVVLAAWQATVFNAVAGGADRFSHEFRLLDVRSGGYRWFLSAAVPLRLPDGRVDQWIGSMADIHDQKTAAEAIRESDSFRRSVFENSPDCLKIFDLDGRVLEINESGCRLLEVDGADTLRGAAWADLWPAANRETIREAVDARAGQVGRFQGFCPTAKGTPKYWDVSVAGVPGADGRPFRLIGVSRDVTEERRAEDAVRASERRFRTLTEAVPQMVWTADPAGEVTFFNRRWDEFTGAPLAVGRTGGWPPDLIHPDDADRQRARWQLAVARAAGGYNEEFRLRRAGDGEYRWMLSVAVPLRDAAGAVVEWVGTLTDIEDQKQQSQTLAQMVRTRTAQLEEANDSLTHEVAERTAAEQRVRTVAVELERSNDELEKFAYVASHDLQEPLRKIQAFGDRLLTKCRDQLPENGKEYVDRMLGAAGRMRRLIDDLLTFSRVTTHRRPFVRVELGKLLRDVVSDLEVRIAQTGGTVTVGDLPDLDGDFTQMRQLFQNLIANALKFHRADAPPVVEVTGELVDRRRPTRTRASQRPCAVSACGTTGSVSTRSTATASSTCSSGSTAATSTKGPGSVWPFAVRSSSGTGVRSLRSARSGKGPRSWSNSRSANLTPARPSKVTPHRSKPITILMADDDPDDRQLTREAFEENHLANDLRFVEDGEELLDYLHRRGKYAAEGAAPPPGLILLDLNMPRKDGREALREIKADPRLRNIRVIILTTSKAEEDMVRELRPVGRVVHHQAGHLRAAGRSGQDAGEVLAGDRGAPARRERERGRRPRPMSGVASPVEG